MARSNILALRQRKATLTKNAKAINDLAQREGRELTSAEHQNYDKITAALQANETELVLEEQRLAEEAGQIGTPDENSAFSLLAHGQTPPDNPLAAKRKTLGRIGCKSWADVFGQPRARRRRLQELRRVSALRPPLASAVRSTAEDVAHGRQSDLGGLSRS